MTFFAAILLLATTLFENCYSNSFATAVRGDAVITGDIPAMWLRDSSAQMWPQLKAAKDDAKLRETIRAVLKRQFASIRLDPYANAFLVDWAAESPWKSDMTEMKKGVYERKFELDSLCYPLRLAYGYYLATNDKTLFDDDWLKTVDVILEVMRAEQRMDGKTSRYKFQRVTHTPGDTLTNYGHGARAKYCGLIASAFRPSDDAMTFPFHIPSNFMAVDVLLKTAEILEKVNGDEKRARACFELAGDVNSALAREAIFDHPKFGRIYAYEVDGFGNALFMDDANVPSLLSLPYISQVRPDDPVYLNTRRFVWSEANPYFFRGTAGEGIGSPHTGLDYIWPMSHLMRGLTAIDEKEVAESLATLEATHAGTYLMHESFHKDDPKRFTREWFAWANALYVELILSHEVDSSRR